MQIEALVAREPGSLMVETIELDPPKAGEVLVRMRAAGICHSDLHTYKGELRTKPPLVLGHEGAGIVEAVGDGVTTARPGDRILINWLPACGTCATCLDGRPNLCERLFKTTLVGMMVDGTSRLRTLDGLPLKHYLGAATMAQYAVVNEASVIPIPGDVPFDVAALIGCGVATGVGAVINTARAQAGRAAAVIGCGGVGLSAIQGCKLAGCQPIIAVDVVDTKLAFACQMGATDTINARAEGVVETLRSRTRIGPDYVFDSVGSATTIKQALEATRPGGMAIIMGLHAALQEVPIPAGILIQHSKHLVGCFVGSISPRVDLPRLVELYRAGRLMIDALISKRYRLKDAVQAFADLEAGVLARGVIVFDQ